MGKYVGRVSRRVPVPLTVTAVSELTLIVIHFIWINVNWKQLWWFDSVRVCVRAASSRIGSVEGAPCGPGARLAYGWTVEECILAACTGQRLHCALHDHLPLSHLAPDAVSLALWPAPRVPTAAHCRPLPATSVCVCVCAQLLLDVEEERRARWEQISRGAVAGRGAFGTVLAAWWRPHPARDSVPVALKALQPVPGGGGGAEHRAAVARWEREPAGAACRAYCALRQELCILSQLRHAHVVPLVAVCGAPLALLLALAPRGALDAALREYRCRGAAVGVRCARALMLQVARALEYLHAQRILYRDLKVSALPPAPLAPSDTPQYSARVRSLQSENVLVWRMPRPQEAVATELSAAPIDVHVKLGDYGQHIIYIEYIENHNLKKYIIYYILQYVFQNYTEVTVYCISS